MHTGIETVFNLKHIAMKLFSLFLPNLFMRVIISSSVPLYLDKYVLVLNVKNRTDNFSKASFSISLGKSLTGP